MKPFLGKRAAEGIGGTSNQPNPKAAPEGISEAEQMKPFLGKRAAKGIGGTSNQPNPKAAQEGISEAEQMKPFLGKRAAEGIGGTSNQPNPQSSAGRDFRSGADETLPGKARCGGDWRNFKWRKTMKKFLMSLVSLCLTVVMVFSLAGCGSKEDSESIAGVETDGKDDVSSQNKLLGNGKLFGSVQEYIDAQQDQIDAAIKQNEGSGMSMEVKADGDTLVYRYIYDDTIVVNELIINSFESNLDLYRSQFEAILEEMEKYVDVTEPGVQLLYENPDGSLVYSCLFTKDGVKTTPGTMAEGATGKMFASVQEYIDAQKDQIDEVKQGLEGSGMSMEIEADGETLVYRYTYEVTIDATQDLEAEFESNLALYQSQFDAILIEMEQLIDITQPAVRLIYENSDGTILYTHTFTK